MVLLAGLALSAVSCRNGADPATEAAAPPVVTTASGIEMVLIPAGRFKMGSESSQTKRPAARSISTHS